MNSHLPAPLPPAPGESPVALANKPRLLQPETPTLETCLAHQHDLADLNVQFHLAGYLGTPQRDLLAVAQDKIKPSVGSLFTDSWAKQAAWHDYDALAGIVASSTYTKAEDLIRCGFSTFTCQDRLFCPLCCYNRLSRQVLEEFGPAFGGDNEVYYVVLSLSSDPDETRRLIFKDVGNDEFHFLKHRARTVCAEGLVDLEYGMPFETDVDLRDCRIMLDFYAEAIREFTGDKHGCLLSGAVGGPELAVRLGPLRVLPHANFIVWSPGLSEGGVRELRKFIRLKMRNCRILQTRLFPSVACYRLRAAEDLCRVVSYIFKPIDLASAYMNAADRNTAPAAMMALNGETNEFLQNALDVFWRLRRVSRYGRCHAGHHFYFGHITEYRREQRERNAKQRAGTYRKPAKKSRADDITRWELHHLDQLDWPRPRHSRFQRWRERNDQPPRPPSAPMPKPSPITGQHPA